MARAADPARHAARKTGARFYVSATPCKAGHEAGERYTSTGVCRQCVASQPRPERRRRNLAAPDPLAAVLG